MGVFIVFCIIAMICYSYFENKELKEIQEEKQRKQIQEQEEQERRIEEAKKIYGETVVPEIKNILQLYEKQLTEIIKSYGNLIESHESLKEMLKKIQDYIKQTYESISFFDIEELNNIVKKIHKYKYLLNNLECLCIEQKQIDIIKDSKENIEELKKVLHNKIDEEDSKQIDEEMKNKQAELSKKRDSIQNSFKEKEEFIIKSRKDINVTISNFHYGEYSQLYADLSIINCSLSAIKEIEIFVKIYENETVVGDAYINQTLMLKPGEEFKNSIRFLSHTENGNRFVVQNYQLKYYN